MHLVKRTACSERKIGRHKIARATKSVDMLFSFHEGGLPFPRNLLTKKAIDLSIFWGGAAQWFPNMFHGLDKSGTPNKGYPSW